MKDWSHSSDDDTQKERWLVTYADLITLLLVFFIVMYALSSRISNANFDHLKNSLAISMKTTKATIAPGERTAVSPEDTRETRAFKANAASVVKAVVATDPKSKVSIAIDQRGLVVSLIDTSFFDPGAAVIKPAAFPVLMGIAKNFRKLPNTLRVEGHTDAAPIHTARFPSNWELSSARATAVVRFMIDHAHLPAARMSAVGYSSNHPVASNGTAEGRMRNRRVEIILERSDDVAGPGAGLALMPASTPAPRRTKAPQRPGSDFANPFADPFGR